MGSKSILPTIAVTPPTDVQEVITLRDMTSQILSNAEVLFNDAQDLKIVTGQSDSGLLFHTAIVASDAKSASAHREYRVIVNGPGGRARRDSMMALLDETERMVAKHVLKR